jgi:alkylated DNA nucleotide flippase Atl1
VSPSGDAPDQGVHRLDFADAVLDLVDTIPSGRVTTYGAIADRLGSGGPRQVGRVMATLGGSVPWWRVVRADGSLPEHLRDEAHQEHLREGTPLCASGRVDLRRAFALPGP